MDRLQDDREQEQEIKSSEVLNETRFRRYLSRYFADEAVEAAMAALHKLPNFGELEIHITRLFSLDGEYHVYWRRFQSPDGSPSIAGLTSGKDRFFKVWTLLELPEATNQTGGNAT